MAAQYIAIAALIAKLTESGLKVWQAWCQQNPSATNEESLAQLLATDADADAAYHASKQKAERLEQKLNTRSTADGVAPGE